MTDRRRRLLVLGSAAAVALAADIVSKVAAEAWLADGPVRLAPLLVLRLVHNEGVAFGVGADVPAPVVLAVTVVVAAAIAVVAVRGALGGPVPAGMMVGGAVANIVDRATAGSVVDFLDVGRWPTFNLADVFLVTGIGLALLTSSKGGTSPAGPEPARGSGSTRSARQ